ncbi:MAG: hypothetical protein KGL55_04250, partial [Rhodospirillales bacterium]|nr:hypothetical protein [Rhodospirillales bacterium]
AAAAMAGVMLAVVAVARPAVALAAPAPALWQVELAQLDPAGAAIGKPLVLACAASGCQSIVKLQINAKPEPFLAAITFVQRGAYLSLESLVPALGQAIGFEAGFKGPEFILLRHQHADTTLRFTLTGAAIKPADPSLPALMPSSQSLVFHRKMAPDFVLRVRIGPQPR